MVRTLLGGRPGRHARTPTGHPAHTADFTPFEVYARSLQQYFKGHEMTIGEWERTESKVWKLLDQYQREGYQALMKIVGADGSPGYNGGFLCDGVGLGKTFVGLMVIERLVKKVPGGPAKPQDLTMGEIQRIFETPELWLRVGLKYDRSTFCTELDKIRELRNGLMHFRDPVGAASLDHMRNFADMLRAACAAAAKTPLSDEGAG